MGENCCTDESCNNGSCNSKSPKTGCEMTDMLMRMADKAWEELMMEKMKKHWEKSVGPRMDKVAKASVDGSNGYWNAMMQSKGSIHMAQDQIKKAWTTK